MKTFLTLIRAIDPITGELTDFAGPNIQAPTESLAFEYCQQNGLGYCHILGQLLMDVGDVYFDYTLEEMN